MTSRSLASLVCLAACAAGCSSLDYDLSGVPVPVSAQRVPEREGVEPFELEAKSVLWVHGALGESSPEVDALVAEAAQGYDRVAGFRVRHSADFHDWLITHLSLTLVRMKSVVIEGQLVRD